MRVNLAVAVLVLAAGSVAQAAAGASAAKAAAAAAPHQTTKAASYRGDPVRVEFYGEGLCPYW